MEVKVMCTASYPVAHLAGNAIPVDLYRMKARIFERPNGLSFSGPSKMVKKSVSFSSFRSFSTFSRMAIGSSNTSEDTDDMYDDLFKNYGKVVYTRNDQKSPIAEVDDDAESLAFAVAAAKVASDVKAADIRVLFVKPLVYWTRFFIITTAFSRPQIEAIRSKIKDLAEEDYQRVATGDSKANSWTLMDFGDVVIHIFLPEQRAYYNLEEFYANATQIELPSENKRPFNTQL